MNNESGRRDVTRRRFLKTGSAGVAGTAATLLSGCRESVENRVNPAIDNCRVVCCHDPAMIKGDPVAWDMAAQNGVVNRERVHADLDDMATVLTATSRPQKAWRTIFRKPDAKAWSDVRVALKVNCVPHSRPRLAVIEKICRELHELGVPYKNMAVYDVLGNAQRYYAEFSGNGLPDGVVVCNRADELGGKGMIDVGEPYPATVFCPRDIVSGAVDIIINLAVNKGHSNNYAAGISLTMKNHTGTLDPKPIHEGGKLDYIIAVNKSSALLGGDPVRQQLCIVDSLWAMKSGPEGIPDTRSHRLIMGTFSPVVDWLVAKRIREPLMNCTHRSIDRFLTDFGYAVSDELQLVDVPPA